MRMGLASLPRTVWILGLISLLNDSASELVYPLLPLYLTGTLAAGPRALGLIEGLAEATASLMKLASGIASDRSGRSRPWIIGGYGLAAIGRPLLSVVGSWPGLLLIRVADRLGKGLRTAPRDALLAASVASGQRGAAFGLQRAMDNAGAVIGPALAALLLARAIPLRQIFLWTAVPSLLCLALTLVLPTSRAPTSSPRPQPGNPGGPMNLRLRRYLFVVSLYALGSASSLFLLLHARALGLPETQVPLLWGSASVVAMLASAPLAGLSDRLGRLPVLLGAYGGSAAFYALLATWYPGAPGLYGLFVAYGLILAATDAVQRAMLADLAPPSAAGAAFGWFHLGTGLMLLPASALFGWLYHSTPPLAFGFSAACALLAAVLLWRWVGTGSIEYHP